jgi:hypothetical protein
MLGTTAGSLRSFEDGAASLAQFSNNSLYLDIQIYNGSSWETFGSRKILEAVPYAFRSKYSDNAGTSTNVPLSGLTAASASNTINNANYNQTWRWALTSPDQTGLALTESTASVSGGTPSILGVSTLASSTAIPIYVQNIGNALSFRVDDQGSDTSPFVVDASGKVGIGTDTPAAFLHIKSGGGVNSGINLEATSAASYGVIDFNTPSGLAGQFLSTGASFSNGIFTGDQGLYSSITDNGAGGISCSVAEMARECNGAVVDLEKVPLKYPGLDPWQIWISESQERMTLSVPKGKWEAFKKLSESRGVEATVIGEFTNSGTMTVRFRGKTVMDISLEFLHNGLPKKQLEIKKPTRTFSEPKRLKLTNATSYVAKLLTRENIGSTEFVSKQYDHEVQTGSVLKPTQGRGRVSVDAEVFRPVPTSPRAVVLTSALFPSYSRINTYTMAAHSIDTAIRQAIVSGGTLNHLAILDNFCWSSSSNPERLFELREAAKACYDFATLYGTPFISGKDSMWNDFRGYDEKGEKVHIAAPAQQLSSASACAARGDGCSCLWRRVRGRALRRIPDEAPWPAGRADPVHRETRPDLRPDQSVFYRAR